MTPGLSAALPTWCRCVSGFESTGSPSALSSLPSTSGASTTSWRNSRCCGWRAGEGLSPQSREWVWGERGHEALAPDSFLCAGWRPHFHALLLPLPHTHGLPCLPPREGECLSRLCVSPWGAPHEWRGFLLPLRCLLSYRWTWQWWRWALAGLLTAPTSSGETTAVQHPEACPGGSAR